MENITKLSELNEVLKNSKVLVKISTSSCGPCQLVKKNLEDIESEYDFPFISVDAEEAEDELLDFLNVRNVPTLVVYENGTEKTRSVGMRTVDQIKEMLS